MGYGIYIKFKKKNQTTPNSINNVIELIPPAYKGGHTQENMMKAMYPSSRYKIDFGNNQDAAEKFAQQLFDNYGNTFDINKDYKK